MTPIRWKRWLVGDALELPNRRIGYYRDKYLMLVCALAIFLALASFDQWPPSRAELIEASLWVAIILGCLAVSPMRWFVLTAALAFLSLRGFIAFFSAGRMGALGFAAVAGMLAAAFGVVASRKYPDFTWPDRYTALEFAIDMAAFIAILFGVIGVQALADRLSHF